MYYIIDKIIAFVVCKLLFRVRYKNIEVLKNFDKCVICPNHSRIFDPIFLYPKIDNMYSMAKSELFKHKIKANFLRHHNVFPVDRQTADIAGLKKGIKLLKSTENIKLLIFPEGRVLKSKVERGNIKNGAVYIASMVEVPIIPIYITARPNFFSKVIVEFGKPIFYNKLELKDKNKVREKSKQLLKEIYNMEKNNL